MQACVSPLSDTQAQEMITSETTYEDAERSRGALDLAPIACAQLSGATASRVDWEVVDAAGRPA